MMKPFKFFLKDEVEENVIVYPITDVTTYIPSTYMSSGTITTTQGWGQITTTNTFYQNQLLTTSGTAYTTTGTLTTSNYFS